MRVVLLPKGVLGTLYLGSMPGRHEPFEEARAAIISKKIGRVVCLSPPDEILLKSPDYLPALERGVPWIHVGHPVGDYGVPGDRAAFWALAQDIARALRVGENVLIHCGAGVGRTGTLAVAALLALGQTLSDADKAVKVAGSGPETGEQKELLGWMAAQKSG